jgi:prolyl-tRNA synthetase
MADNKKLTARSDDQAEWYQEVVQRARLADYSPVRGSMVIRPYGYAIWEAIQQEMNARIKAAGVQNAYFPLFIPYAFLEQEADHVEGFAPEVAIVTHAGGKELEEKLVVRPTSETIIYRMFSEWVQSYRDLPIKINQWANVVRWEKRTVPFLRTTEFLWQEGHTIHATEQEAKEEMIRALNMYHDFCRDMLAMPTIKGYKTEAEKFAGAKTTTTIESLMKDKKALQSGTSHTLNQSFAASFNVNFTDENGEQQTVWPTSWGFSTRIIGGLILMHGDDKGLVLPPRIAPIKAIIIPIVKAETESAVMAHVERVEELLKDSGISYEVDRSDSAPGFKFSEAEMRGIPLRLEIGGKDVESDSVMVVKRNTGGKESIALSTLVDSLKDKLAEMQAEIFQAAEAFTKENTHSVSSKEEFYALAGDEPVGYIQAFFCGDKVTEAEVKEATKYTTRCVPFATFEQEGTCIFTGKPGKLTLFAKAY